MTKNKDQSVIPNGHYCYDENGVCPYWSIREDQPAQRNGHCSYLEQGDWEVTNENLPEELQSASSLLWDQVKECGIKLSTKEELMQLVKDGKAIIRRSPENKSGA